MAINNDKKHIEVDGKTYWKIRRASDKEDRSMRSYLSEVFKTMQGTRPAPVA